MPESQRDLSSMIPHRPRLRERTLLVCQSGGEASSAGFPDYSYNRGPLGNGGCKLQTYDLRTTGGFYRIDRYGCNVGGQIPCVCRQATLAGIWQAVPSSKAPECEIKARQIRIHYDHRACIDACACMYRTVCIIGSPKFWGAGRQRIRVDGDRKHPRVGQGR